MYFDFRYFVSSLTDVATIAQFLSGILVCKQYVINKTTAESSPLPFICGVMSCGMWLLYGISKHDNNITLVNTVGLILMSAYVIVFYIFTFKKYMLLKYVMLILILGFLIFAYYSLEDDYDILFLVIGICASGMTVVTIGAPMSQLNYVMRVKNTACLPFPMILMSFIVTSLWLLYGILEVDLFIVVPNLLGVLLTLTQLSLFFIYPSQPHTSLNKYMEA